MALASHRRGRHRRRLHGVHRLGCCSPDVARTRAPSPGSSPDCLVLFRRLLGDDRVPRRSKLLLAALIGYLAMPFDLVPDFIPVAGQLDDAIIVALVLRTVLRAGGPDLLREHWPGPTTSLNALMRLAYGRAKTTRPD